MKKYIVYIHTCPNNKKYVGVTSLKPYIRWGKGWQYRNNEQFYNDIQLYGWENIKHEIVARKCKQSFAYSIEKHLISKYKSNVKEFGYNIESGGKRIVTLDSTKKKISESLSGINHPMYGKHLTEEHKEAFIEGNRKKCRGKNHPMFGKHHSEESKNKISENSARKRKVICLTTEKSFNTIADAAKYYDTHSSHISQCCSGIRKSAGRDFETGRPLIWKYE